MNDIFTNDIFETLEPPHGTKFNLLGTALPEVYGLNFTQKGAATWQFQKTNPVMPARDAVSLLCWRIALTRARIRRKQTVVCW